jgi:hypothetical protein
LCERRKSETEADYGRREGTYNLVLRHEKPYVERGGFKTITKMEKERANNELATQ